MAVYVNNLRVPTLANQRGTSVGLMVYREMMLSGYWTEKSNDGDAAWANNIIATPADCAVSAAVALRITAPSAPFTQAMADDGDFITLLASSDQNRGVYKIKTFIDAQTIDVDIVCAPPDGWVTESGISARIVGVNDNLLANGAWVLMDSPSATCQLQARLYKQDGSWAYGYARPRGKDFSGSGAGAPDAIGGAAPNMSLTVNSAPFLGGMVGLNVTIAGSTTPANDGVFTITGVSVDGKTIYYTNAGGVVEPWAGTYSVAGLTAETAGVDTMEYYFNEGYFNGFFDGDIAAMYAFEDENDIHVLGFGELGDADPADFCPGYVYGFKDTGWNYDAYAWNSNVLCYMLDVNDNQIQAWTSWTQWFLDTGDGDAYENRIQTRLMNGNKAVLRRSRIWLANVASVGAVPRGYLEGFRWTNVYFEPFRPLDGVGQWLHLGGGLVVPRNGYNARPLLVP